MSCTITDLAISLNALNVPVPKVGAKILVVPTNTPLFVTLDGAAREIWDPTRSVVTDQAGTWTVVLPWPSEQDPSINQWVITLPDGSQWQGEVPEGVAGPITLFNLKESYGWQLVEVIQPNSRSLIPVVLQPPGKIRVFALADMPAPTDYPVDTIIVVRDPDSLGNRFLINVAQPTRSWAPFLSEYPVFDNPPSLPVPRRDGMIALTREGDNVSPGTNTALGGVWYQDIVGHAVGPAVGITSFSPSPATEGTLVTVVGHNFDTATAVSVAGVDQVFTVVDPQHLTFHVAVGTTSGRIHIVNPVGFTESSTSLVIPFAPPTDPYGIEVFADNPATWYRLASAPYVSGATIQDASGNGNAGQIHGSWTTTTPGLVSGDANAPQGQGGSTWVTGTTIYPTPTGVTVEFWHEPRDIVGFGANMDIGSGDNFSPGVFGNLPIEPGTPQQISFQLIDDLSTGGPTITSPGTLAFDTRYHVVFTYDDTLDEGRLYLNNVLVAGPISMRPPDGLFANTQNFGFGRVGAVAGELQEMAIYGKALSPARIAAHFNAA